MKLNKKTLAVSTASLIIIGGGAAYAYVTAGGTGQGSAGTVAAVQQVTLAAALPATLEPSDAVSPHVYNIAFSGTNPNHFTVQSNVVVGLGTLPSGCEGNSFTITNGTTSVRTTAAGGVTLVGSQPTIEWASETATSSCIGQTIPLTVTVTS
jgi:hypothetical protein